MIECGYYKPGESTGSLWDIMNVVMCGKWKTDDYIFALYLIGHGATVSLNFLPWTHCVKENIQRLLRRDTDCEFKSWKFCLIFSC
jgi:hypothetical protein